MSIPPPPPPPPLWRSLLHAVRPPAASEETAPPPARPCSPDSGFLPETPANNYLQAQGYGSMVNYTKAVLFMPPKVPIGGVYRPWIIVDKHVNSTPVTRHSMELNANFHLDFSGVVLRNATGAFNGQLAVNLTAALGPAAKGWQKLNIQGKALDPLTNATNTGALNVFFEVSHGEPPVSSCGVGPVQTHAADGWASTASKFSSKGAWQFSSSKVNTTGTVTIAPPIPAGTNGTSQRAAVFSYDLSFLQLPTGASNASVWVFRWGRQVSCTALRSLRPAAVRAAGGGWARNARFRVPGSALLISLVRCPGRSTNDGGIAGATVQAWDASNATLCVDPACGAPIGSGTLSPTNRWSEIKLDAAYLLRQLRCKGVAAFALALPAVSVNFVSPTACFGAQKREAGLRRCDIVPLPQGTPSTAGVLIGATLGQATPPLLVTRACGTTPVLVTC